jgi:hypothetical protein
MAISMQRLTGEASPFRVGVPTQVLMPLFFWV